MPEFQFGRVWGSSILIQLKAERRRRFVQELMVPREDGTTKRVIFGLCHGLISGGAGRPSRISSHVYWRLRPENRAAKREKNTVVKKSILIHKHYVLKKSELSTLLQRKKTMASGAERTQKLLEENAAGRSVWG